MDQFYFVALRTFWDSTPAVLKYHVQQLQERIIKLFVANVNSGTNHMVPCDRKAQ